MELVGLLVTVNQDQIVEEVVQVRMVEEPFTAQFIHISKIMGTFMEVAEAAVEVPEDMSHGMKDMEQIQPTLAEVVEAEAEGKDILVVLAEVEEDQQQTLEDLDLLEETEALDPQAQEAQEAEAEEVEIMEEMEEMEEDGVPPEAAVEVAEDPLATLIY